jgi:hypothetical protein
MGTGSVGIVRRVADVAARDDVRRIALALLSSAPG